MSQETVSDSQHASYGSHISSLLRRLSKLYGALLAKDLKSVGLTPPQMMVLRQVYTEPKTLGSISQAVQLSNSTCSGILDRLERDGYIERVRDDNDRRIIWIRKTDKLTDLTNKFSLFQESFYDHVFDDLSEAEMDNIVRSLDILITHLESKIEDETPRSW
ncbi:MarR family transcriptional regulator [Paenibacillus sp. P26]|nr:MarR family transcriptional regulator [Paenibacillus sp. P26]UUZ94281.1 MarR family transcriptional regulator [Paenibacillus sp. P25]